MTPPSPTVEPIDPDELIGASDPLTEPVEPIALTTPINCLECRLVTYHAHWIYSQLCQSCGAYVSQLERLGEQEERVVSFVEVCIRAVGGGSGEIERRWRIG